jgi:hypothetical protein
VVTNSWNAMKLCLRRTLQQYRNKEHSLNEEVGQGVVNDAMAQ